MILILLNQVFGIIMMNSTKELFFFFGFFIDRLILAIAQIGLEFLQSLQSFAELLKVILKIANVGLLFLEVFQAFFNSEVKLININFFYNSSLFLQRKTDITEELCDFISTLLDQVL